MPSETDLLNDALSMIGAKEITSIDDGSINANHCKRLYPNLRDSVLRSHHWNFAMKRVELAQDATAPAFEFAFAYTLPPDCLKVVEYNGANLDTSSLSLFEAAAADRYKIEQRKLLTNDGSVKIVYIQRVTDPNLWDSLFYQMLSTWLASKLAMPISKDVRMSSGLLDQVIKLMLPLATAVDGQEGSVEPYRSDSLTRGR